MKFDVQKLQERSDIEDWELDFVRLAWDKITSWMVLSGGAYDEATVKVAVRKCDRSTLGLIMQKCKANNINFVKDALGLPQPKKKKEKKQGKAQPKSMAAKKAAQDRARQEHLRAAQAAKEAKEEKERRENEAAEERAKAVNPADVVQAVSAQLKAVVEKQPAVQPIAGQDVELVGDFAGLVSLSAALSDESQHTHVATMVEHALGKPCGMLCTRYLKIVQMLGAGKVGLSQGVLNSMETKAQYEQAVRDVNPTGVSLAIANPDFPGQLKTNAQLVERQVRAYRNFLNAATEGGMYGLKVAWTEFENTRASVRAISTEVDIFDASAKSESQLAVVNSLAEVMEGAPMQGSLFCAS